MTADPPLLEMAGVGHRYGRSASLSDISFSLGKGTIGCLMGPSGSGKSTALSCIAGLEPVSEGSVRINGKVASERGSTLAPERRSVGMLFQDFALFPHLTVEQNIAFGLGRAGGAGGLGGRQHILNRVADLRFQYGRQLGAQHDIGAAQVRQINDRAVGAAQTFKARQFGRVVADQFHDGRGAKDALVVNQRAAGCNQKRQRAVHIGLGGGPVLNRRLTVRVNLKLVLTRRYHDVGEAVSVKHILSHRSVKCVADVERDADDRRADGQAEDD